MEVDFINKETIKALLYFPDNGFQKYSYMKSYIDEYELCSMLIVLNTLIKKAKLSSKDMIVLNYLKNGRTHEEIANELKITRSAVSHKLNNIVNKLYKVV